MDPTEVVWTHWHYYLSCFLLPPHPFRFWFLVYWVHFLCFSPPPPSDCLFYYFQLMCQMCRQRCRFLIFVTDFFNFHPPPLFGSWLVRFRQYSSSKFPSFYPPPPGEGWDQAFRHGGCCAHQRSTGPLDWHADYQKVGAVLSLVLDGAFLLVMQAKRNGKGRGWR